MKRTKEQQLLIDIRKCLRNFEMTNDYLTAIFITKNERIIEWLKNGSSNEKEDL